MKQTELEMQILRDELDEMWKLVLSQIEKAKQAYLQHDKELAYEIISREKRVNAFDSKIDSDCENYIALYAPVAVDLRLVLSLLKITNTLERIGDFAEGIARQVLEEDFPKLDPNLAEDLHVEKIYDIVVSSSDGQSTIEEIDIGIKCFHCYSFLECKILEKPV